MKCPKCNGTGNIANGMWLCCECQGTGFIEDEKPSEPMTNEEWIKSLDTEQLAEWLVFKRKLLRIPETNYEVWIQWLKEKHTE